MIYEKPIWYQISKKISPRLGRKETKSDSWPVDLFLGVMKNVTIDWSIISVLWVGILKLVHLRTQLRDPHFFQKLCHFCWPCFEFSENDNTFERNEDRITGFLKWTNFFKSAKSVLFGHYFYWQPEFKTRSAKMTKLLKEMRIP